MKITEQAYNDLLTNLTKDAIKRLAEAGVTDIDEVDLASIHQDVDRLVDTFVELS